MYRWNITPFGVVTKIACVVTLDTAPAQVYKPPITEIHHSPPTDSADFSSETTGAD